MTVSVMELEPKQTRPVLGKETERLHMWDYCKNVHQYSKNSDDRDGDATVMSAFGTVTIIAIIPSREAPDNTA